MTSDAEDYALVLKAVKSSLAGLATSSEASARDVLGAVDIALDYLLRRLGPKEPEDIALAAERDRLIAVASTLVGASRSVPEDRILEEAATRLAGASSDQVSQPAKDWLRDVVSFESRASVRLATPTLVGTVTDGEEDSLPSAEALGAYLASHGIDGTIVRIGQFTGGFSRRTLLVELQDGSASRDLVIRQQQPGGLLEELGTLSIIEEFPLLRVVHEAGVPVPEPMWLEDDGAVLGSPFIVMPRASGKVIGSSYHTDAPPDEMAFKELARVMAGIHAVDWRKDADRLGEVMQLADPSSMTTTDLMHDLLRRWQHFLDKTDPMSPSVAAAFEWLQRNVPAPLRDPVLLHGDIGFHNILFHEGRITALLDWELGFLGDAAKDLAQVRAFVCDHMEWQDFYRFYLEAGGREIDESTLRYYGVLMAFSHVAVSTASYRRATRAGTLPDLRYLTLGVKGRPHFLAHEFLRDGAPIWS